MHFFAMPGGQVLLLPAAGFPVAWEDVARVNNRLDLLKKASTYPTFPGSKIGPGAVCKRCPRLFQAAQITAVL
jgi:hypothetical protein